MKRFMFVMIMSVIIAVSSWAAGTAGGDMDMEKEKAAIKQATLDYVEGWYEGNPERMDRALHPELVKRAPRPLPNGRTIISYASKSNMVEYTRAGFGKKIPKDKANITCKILDIYNNIASVKTTTVDFIDYVHLVKIEGKWKVINVLWEGAKPPAPAAVKKEKKGGDKMSYYFSKIVDMSFEQAIDKVSEELKKEGFGILTRIDVKATLKKKLDVDFRKYQILGACNPNFAYQALQKENKIGVMLPCNVIVQEIPGNKIEVAAVDPIASMMGVENPELGAVANQVQAKLKRVMDNL